MSRMFLSKEDVFSEVAAEMKIDPAIFKTMEPEPLHLGWPQDLDLETYSFTAENGEKVRIGMAPFREGFDLWLIDDQSGMARRV